MRVNQIFTRLRGMVLTHKDILLKLEQMEREVVQQDDDIRLIFDYLKELLNPKTEPMRKIGFKIKDEESSRHASDTRGSATFPFPPFFFILQ